MKSFILLAAAGAALAQDVASLPSCGVSATHCSYHCQVLMVL